MVMTFAKPALIKLGGNALTDHNRSELSITVTRIENRTRTATGALRKFYVADKRTFSLSWTMIPEDSTKTVDGFWGGADITNFYETTTGPFALDVTYKTGEVDSFTVVFNAFDKTIVKRWGDTYVNIDIELEEV